jgi:SM-20-related protein
MTASVFSSPPQYGRAVDWLGQRMVTQLLEFAQTKQDSFREAPIWNQAKGNNEVTVAARRSWRIKDLGDFRNEIQARARAMLPEMCRHLGSAPFEPSKLEMELVAHGDGAFYTEHRDPHSQSPLATRLISAVYYFHRLPKTFSGGALRIYSIAGSKKSTAFVEIEPINDTIVFFPSWFPHEVLLVNCPSGQFEDSRFAINCWFHC